MLATILLSEDVPLPSSSCRDVLGISSCVSIRYHSAVTISLWKQADHLFLVLDYGSIGRRSSA